MNRHFTTQAASFALSVLITVCTLAALDALAGSEHAAPQLQQAAAATLARG